MTSANGNGPTELPAEVLDSEPAPAHFPPPEPSRTPLLPLLLSAGLFLATLMTTLAVGAQFAAAFARNEAFSLDDYARDLVALFTAPRLLLPGLDFAVTLMAILLAHELGHWFACRHHRIRATLPFFIPAPTLIGTFGAFILIRSPIRSRRALFDVGFSGPLVGLILAVPALIVGVLHSKVVPGPAAGSGPLFGTPLLLSILVALLRPGISPQALLLHPIARAAWVGLLATALNLLPAGQLDGGHILRAVSARWHRRVTLALPFLLLPLGFFLWRPWLLWSVLLAIIGLRRTPPLYDWRPLDRSRLTWAAVALLIFLLCFMPIPVHESALR
jgi:membrane-associated protease RseP (regulator of RpoE activity)